MKKEVIHILLVEDNDGDARLLMEMIPELSFLPCRITRVKTLAESLRLLDQQSFQMILLDLSLPDSQGMNTVTTILRTTQDIPVVVLTGLFDEELGFQMVQSGAQDYLVKGEVTRETLTRSILYSAERKSIERKLQEANKELQHLNQLKSDFLATASHELRTPLTIIREYISLVRDEVTGTISQKQRECLTSAFNNCERLNTLINNILDLQAIESGRVMIRRSRCNILRLISKCCDDFQEPFKQKSQVLELDLPHDLPPALCDSDGISQVLVNLIGNAHKFVPESGRVSVRARANGTRTYVTVVDNGPGISKEDRKRVFEKFVQLDRTHGPGAKGTGLGLSICKSIIELHGGRLELKSEPGMGCTFTFSLPIYREPEGFRVFVSDRQQVARSQNKHPFLILFRVGKKIESMQNTVVPQNLKFLKQIESIVKESHTRNEVETLLSESQPLLFVIAHKFASEKESCLRRLQAAIKSKSDSDTPLYAALVPLVPVDGRIDVIDQALGELLEFHTGLSNQRILLVDDDPALSGSLAELLQESFPCCEIITSMNGYDACYRIGQLSPNAVILDLNMPGLDGKFVLRQIRETEQTKNMTVIGISGSEEEIDLLKSLGADDGLAKPFDHKVLVSRLRKVLDQSSHTSQISEENENNVLETA